MPLLKPLIPKPRGLVLKGQPVKGDGKCIVCNIPNNFLVGGINVCSSTCWNTYYRENVISLPSSLGVPSPLTLVGGQVDKGTESLELEGRLIELLGKRVGRNIKRKRIHETFGFCWQNWVTCNCSFAKDIRAIELGLEDTFNRTPEELNDKI